MAVWDRKILWSFVFLLAGAVGQSVNYPDPVCAVKGSTVTLPCTFTPKSVIQDGREVSIEIIRVVWCQNHAICQLTTPSVYDSESNNNRPRYKYLGDKKGNCTLQISDLQEDDDATLRFRMEATNVRGHYTGQSGVKLTVTDWTRMEINSCSGDREVRRGETVTLCCTADCTVHPLEITWFRDGHALSESGPALQLGPLTPGDSGNYTCSLKTNFSTLSPPYSVHVEAEEEGSEQQQEIRIRELRELTWNKTVPVTSTATSCRPRSRGGGVSDGNPAGPRRKSATSPSSSNTRTGPDQWSKQRTPSSTARSPAEAEVPSHSHPRDPIKQEGSPRRQHDDGTSRESVCVYLVVKLWQLYQPGSVLP
ncbi:uncharacterized protein LOC122881075 isoform X1 [Siniperca chuatsi]|uniref:uncharacterized protein LOC122881075 isoform X1 n=1 Tax=Siniperca chuatsi TaxID=119488 RepID=UPI001CE06D91|nr:uncharacterized protein LOC122881075 isoform X1 [Siniperca chuatsi]